MAVVCVQFTYTGDYAIGAPYQWKWDRQHGLGALGDLGAHLIDLARLMVGEIARIHASLSVRVPKAHPEGTAYEAANNSATPAVQFANGAVGKIFTNTVAKMGNKGQEQRVTLFGEDGTLEVLTNFNAYSLRGPHGNETEFQEIPIPDGSCAEPNETRPSLINS